MKKVQQISIQISFNSGSWESNKPTFHTIEEGQAASHAQVVANATQQAVRLTYIPEGFQYSVENISRLNGHYFHPKPQTLIP